MVKKETALNTLKLFDMKADDLNVPFKVFKKKFPLVVKNSITQRTFRRYRKALGFTNKNGKSDKESNKGRLKNRTNFTILDGCKVLDFSCFVAGRVRQREVTKMWLMIEKNADDQDYHSIESLENLRKLNKEIGLYRNYTTSDNLTNYKTFFKLNRRHIYIKNKNASISPERFIRIFKDALLGSNREVELNNRDDFEKRISKLAGYIELIE